MLADFEKMQHVARLALLAMAARAVVYAESQSSPEVVAMVFTVSAADLDTLEVEFKDRSGFSIGGMSL